MQRLRTHKRYIPPLPPSKAAAQFSGDLEVDPSDEATVSPMVNPEEQEMVRKKILDSQYKCFEKMNRQPPYNKTGRTSSRSRTSAAPRLPLFRRSSVLQPQLGRLAVLGRHASGHLRLSELPKLLRGLRPHRSAVTGDAALLNRGERLCA